MNIKAVELMVINKGLKFGEEPNTKTSESLAEPPVSKPQSGLNALEMQMNNVAFMGKSAVATKLKGKALGAMMALMSLGAASTLQSCDSLMPKSEQNQSVVVDIDLSSIMAIYQQMLEMNKQMLEQSKITNEQLVKMNTYLMQLIQEVQNGNISADEYYKRAYEFMTKTESYQKMIVDQLVANGKSQEDANKYLQELISKVENGQLTFKAALDEIQKILGSIDSKLDSIIGKLDEAIKKFEDRDDGTKEQLISIRDLIKQNNKISSDNYELLNSILVNMNKLCTSDQVMEALNTITGILKEQMAQDKEMDTKTHELLNEALKYIAAVGFEMNRNFTALIQEVKNGNISAEELVKLVSELKTLVLKQGEDNKKLGDEILNYIAAVGFEMNRNFGDLIDAVTNGNMKLDQAISLINDLKFIVENKEGGKEFNEEILNYIAALGFEMNRNFSALIQEVKNGNYKLDDITALMEELTKLVADHNKDSKELGDKVLNYIAALGFDMNKNFTAVINAINNIEAGGDDTTALENLLKKVLANQEKDMKNQDKNTKAIIEAMGKIKLEAGDVNIDLSSVEKMMNELLAQVKKNGNVLTNIDAKLDVINLTTKAILDKIEKEAQKGDTRYAKLEALMNSILNKMGTSGVSYDDSKLLEILGSMSNMIDNRMGELLDAIKDHNVNVTVDVTGKVKCECDCGKNHEGIIGDLEDLMK